MTTKQTQIDQSFPPFDFVLFGGTGDLAMRKILPALYHQHYAGLMPENARVISIARSKLTREAYTDKAKAAIHEHVSEECYSEQVFQSFAERLYYQSIDVGNADAYKPLDKLFGKNNTKQRIYYFSTGPDLFMPICLNLAKNKLINKYSRLAVEKPLGHNLESARQISQTIGSVFDESQIYRIDHYLGKEPVQNLLALRFGNALFEPLWRRGHIRDVQITVAETLGVEGRGEFYDKTGALRDMVQNHLLQLLTIIAMEAPSQDTPDAVRDEKLKVLRSLRPLENEKVAKNIIRGQYRSGAVGNQVVPSYLDEPGISADSKTETFVAIRANIDNWRWADVPFYLRTGKRLNQRCSEIVINFERLPHAIFKNETEGESSNHLVIRLQPEESIQLSIRTKIPGAGMRLQPVDLNLDLAATAKNRQTNSYEQLIGDLLRGNQTLFVRHDELEAAWTWINPILDVWESEDAPAPIPYNSGTNGPAEASHLLFETKSRWHREQ